MSEYAPLRVPIPKDKSRWVPADHEPETERPPLLPNGAELKLDLGDKAETATSPPTRENILEMARGIISSDRNAQYGEPEQNFAAIAELWTVYKDMPFDPHDVAVMQMLVKVARIKQSPGKTDHWVDIAGYAACGGEVS